MSKELERIPSKWHCTTCKQPVVSKPRVEKHKNASSYSNGKWTKGVIYDYRRCYECGGRNWLTAYDVKNEKDFKCLDDDEQRRVANGVGKDTPTSVVVAVLAEFSPALNHEDEDLIPAINEAIRRLLEK